MNQENSTTEELVITPVGYVTSELTEMTFRPDREMDPKTRKEHPLEKRSDI